MNTFHLKDENSVIIYSPSWCSKTFFLLWNIKDSFRWDIFNVMEVNKVWHCWASKLQKKKIIIINQHRNFITVTYIWLMMQYITSLLKLFEEHIEIQVIVQWKSHKAVKELQKTWNTLQGHMDAYYFNFILFLMKIHKKVCHACLEWNNRE